MDTTIYCEVISLDWQAALLAYDINRAGFVDVELVDTDGAVIKTQKSKEASGCGRLMLEELLPDTAYTGTLHWAEGEKAFSFRTMEAAKGSQLSSYAVVADPHLSKRKENRKGRFFVESEMIFRHVITQCNQLALDYVLIPGDVTNDGNRDEYASSAECLSLLKCPWIAVPGNHDIHDAASRRDWGEFLGETEGITETPFGIVVALDTSNAMLSQRGIDLIKTGLEQTTDKRVIIVSHYQLFHNDYINRGHGTKVIKNAGDHDHVLDALQDCSAIIYAGHQNILSVQQYGRATQVNLPQPTQYPCGFTYVRCFENGFYHQFIPIESEVMRQWSRRAGDQAAEFYNEPWWEGDYRHGESVCNSNFILKG